MKSYRSFTGVKGGLAVLPTLEERPGDAEMDSSRERTSTGSSSSAGGSPPLGGQGASGNTTGYPVDLLGMSWGSYLNSGPPTRTAGQLRGADHQTHAVQDTTNEGEGSGGMGAEEELKGDNEPHPLLEHLEGLMISLTRSKQELTKCGLDVTPLTTLCGATLSSHSELKRTVKALSRGGTNCDNVTITPDLMHNLVEYIREVLQGLVSQGRKLNVQAVFLQQTAKQLTRQQRECLKEQTKSQEAIDRDRILLHREKMELDKQRQSILGAEEELKRVLVEAEENLNQGEGKRKKGRMDSPHSVAQGRTQLAALVQTQKQQSRLDKILTQQQRDIRHLQQAHSFTKSELLAMQDRAEKLQRKLSRQINEAKSSESELTSRLHVTRESLAYPSMALDKEKRKSYNGTSKAQVKATLKGIAAAQKTLSTEIERMQRQFSEQHATEQRVSRQLEESGQRLQEMDSRVQGHIASIKGVRRRISRTTIHQEEEEEQVTLPEIHCAAPERPQRKNDKITLPKLDQPSHTAAARGKSKRLGRLPQYQFSKSELFTLARFGDHDTEDQVMEWLRSQGKLK